MPTLAPLAPLAPAADEGATPREVQFISNGELRLAEFKQLLTRSGIPSEFNGGQLVVNSAVIVRKQGPRDLTVEGAFGELSGDV